MRGLRARPWECETPPQVPTDGPSINLARPEPRVIPADGKAFIRAARVGADVSFRVGSSVFKDQGKLSFDYVPDTMAHREKQIQRLFSYFRPIVEAGASSNAFLYGPVGTGKTHSAKRFCQDFKKFAGERDRAVDFYLVTCRQRMGADAG